MPGSWGFSPHLTRIRTKRLGAPTKWRRSDGTEPRDKNLECRNVQEVCVRYSPPANPPGNLPSPDIRRSLLRALRTADTRKVQCSLAHGRSDRLVATEP